MRYYLENWVLFSLLTYTFTDRIPMNHTDICDDTVHIVHAPIIHSVLRNKMLLEKPTGYRKVTHCKTTMLAVQCSSLCIFFLELMQAYKSSRMVGRRLKEDSWWQGCAWWRNMDGVHQGWKACLPDQCA
jgi:hypothetical protein